MEYPQESLFQIKEATGVSINFCNINVADECHASPGIGIYTNPQTGHANAMTQFLKLWPMLLDFLENRHTNSLASEHCD
ncbi:hypothetical protein [Terriglobus sp. ADX1]|uniref:hypothetical protein n=1 Tax=Terriglobus sp. ADX1 TaxID=2794063 RepID=UPI002FE61AA8